MVIGLLVVAAVWGPSLVFVVAMVVSEGRQDRVERSRDDRGARPAPSRIVLSHVTAEGVST